MVSTLFKDYSKYTAVVIGTGPSINDEQISFVKKVREEDKCRIFTMNNSYQIIKPDVHFSCNYQWWDVYFKEDPKLTKLKETVDMWTWNENTAKKYSINHVPGKWEDGLSTDPNWIHFGHGSGYETLGVCVHYNPKKILLLGYDLKFPDQYNGRKKITGGKRHYFGEYHKTLQHWPSVKVGKNGVLDGLLEVYEKVNPKTLNMEIVNCTPGSSLKKFRMSTLEKEL